MENVPDTTWQLLPSHPDRALLAAGKRADYFHHVLQDIGQSDFARPLFRRYAETLRGRAEFWGSHNPYPVGTTNHERWRVFCDYVARFHFQQAGGCPRGRWLKGEALHFRFDPPVWNGERTNSPVGTFQDPPDTSHTAESADASQADPCDLSDPCDDSRAAERVLGVLERFGASTSRETAARLRGMDSAVVNATLLRLEADGKVQSVKLGRKTLYAIQAG